MNEYKLHTGISRTFQVTNKEDFEEQTGHNKNYRYTGEDGATRGLAVCPACDNPVRILGLYKKLESQKPHARHHNSSTTFADYVPEAYFHCPLADYSNVQCSDLASKHRPLTKYEKEMYFILRDYFDKAIYLLNQDLDIRISNAFAKRLLQEFMINKGYMDSQASIYNLPWILLSNSFSFNLIGHQVKRGGKLHNFLSNLSDIKLTPYIHKDKDGKEMVSHYDIIEKNNNKYIVLEGHFIQHTRKVIDDNIKESIGFGLSDSKNVPVHWIFRTQYEINQHRFPNLCDKGKDKFRNSELLKISKAIMPDI